MGGLVQQRDRFFVSFLCVLLLLRVMPVFIVHKKDYQ